jgi:hypothetical protein
MSVSAPTMTVPAQQPSQLPLAGAGGQIAGGASTPAVTPAATQMVDTPDSTTVTIGMATSSATNQSSQVESSLFFTSFTYVPSNTAIVTPLGVYWISTLDASYQTVGETVSATTMPDGSTETEVSQGMSGWEINRASMSGPDGKALDESQFMSVMEGYATQSATLPSSAVAPSIKETTLQDAASVMTLLDSVTKSAPHTSTTPPALANAKPVDSTSTSTSPAQAAAPTPVQPTGGVAHGST